MAAAAMAFTEAADWHFPRSMVLPLIYWILVCSVLGYYAVTWAMRHLPASQVSRPCAAGGGRAAGQAGQAGRHGPSWLQPQNLRLGAC